MKLMPVLCAAALSAWSATAAYANADLATKKQCLACHQVDKKVLGPSYKEVAAKYRGQGDAEAKLAGKIIKGGVGVWGQIPMPPNPAVSEAEAKELAKWILSLK